MTPEQEFGIPRMRIIEVITSERSIYYVQQRRRFLFFRWWGYHVYHDYSMDYNFKTMEQAREYVFKVRNRYLVGRRKVYHYF